VRKPQRTRAPISPQPLLSEAMLNVLSRHFVALSGVGIIFAVLCATVFTSSYLSTFDRQLIWLIEYTDLLKVGLIGLAFLLGFVGTLFAVLDWSFDAEGGQKALKNYTITLAALALVLLALLMGLVWYSGSNSYGVLVSVWGTLCILIFTIFMAVYFVRHGSLARARDLAFILFMLIISSSVLGYTYGELTMTRPRDHFTVHLADRVIEGAKLVMLTSRYAVFYFDRKTIVVPAAAVTRMEKWQ